MKTRIKVEQTQDGKINYYAQYRETREYKLPPFMLWAWCYAHAELSDERKGVVKALTESGETPLESLERAQKIIDLLLEQEVERKAAEVARKVKKTTYLEYP